MALYELEQGVIADLLTLVSSPTLQIAASQAQRVAYLQSVLANLKPNNELEERAKELEERAKELEERAKERDAARDLAVSLEQELAAERERHEVTRSALYRANYTALSRLPSNS